MFFKKATTGRNNIIWYVLGVMAVLVGYIVGQMPLLAVQLYQVENDIHVQGSILILDLCYMNVV